MTALEPLVAAGSWATPIRSRPAGPAAGLAQVEASVHAPTLQAEVESLLATSPLGRHASVSVVDVATGRSLVDIAGDRSVPPGSTQKLLTAIAAFDVLGPEHRFVTRATGARDAVRDGETLRGDLVLRGDGDPSLDAAGLRRLADDVADSGITRIEGDVVGDSAAFDTQRWVQTWPERYHVHDARALTGLSVSQNIEGDVILPRNSQFPDILAARVFRDALEQRGVTIDGSFRTTPDMPLSQDPALAIAELDSAPLRDIVGFMLHRSSSTVAEMLTKQLGRSDGAAGSTVEGVKVIRERLAALGAPIEHSVILDGSGLSPATRTTASSMAQTLRIAARNPQLGSELVDAMSMPGEQGTLAKRLLDLAGRAHFKTGTHDDALDLAGLLDQHGGGQLAVSAVVHDPAGVERAVGRPLLDDIVRTIARHEDHAAAAA